MSVASFIFLYMLYLSYCTECPLEIGMLSHQSLQNLSQAYNGSLKAIMLLQMSFLLLVKIFPSINLKNSDSFAKTQLKCPLLCEAENNFPRQRVHLLSLSYSTFFIPLLRHSHCIVAVYLSSYDSAWNVISTDLLSE